MRHDKGLSGILNQFTEEGTQYAKTKHDVPEGKGRREQVPGGRNTRG